MKKNYEVILPFSPAFKETWDLWKQYKSEQFNFRYKSALSEQSALKHVVEISGGREEGAVRIISNSIANGWMGLFELKPAINGKQQPESKEARIADLKVAYSQRYGQSTGG